MGRELRMVPPDWQHPRDAKRGSLIPLLNRDVLEYQNEETPEDERVDEADLMPDFGDTATHFCMYEDTSEGTPISPVFGTREELARWLADNGASVFADMTISYEDWLAVIEKGSPGMIIGGGKPPRPAIPGDQEKDSTD